MFIHLNVDDEDTYIEHSEFTKFSWSKYKCYSKSETLLDLYQNKGNKIGMDILTSKYGIMDTIDVLNAKEYSLHSYDIFSGYKNRIYFRMGTAEYNEYLLYASMTNARNVGRLNGWKQADYLQNKDYVELFCSRYSNNLLKEIYSMKYEVENRGYGVINNNKLNTLVMEFMKYLQELQIGE